MATIPITITVGGLVSAATVTSLTRSDNGLAATTSPAVPISLTPGSPSGGNYPWTGSFDDASPPQFYIATGAATLTNGTTVAFASPFNISGTAAPIVGFWTSQVAIERYIGGINADTLSNLNNTQTGPDPQGYQDAIDRAEAFTNYELQLFLYPSGATNPTFPTDNYAYPILALNTTVIAAVWLYNKRGSYDEAAKLAGAFAKAEADAKAEIKAIIRNKIAGINRGISSNPTVILNPAIYGFGAKNPLPLTANMIPGLP